MNNLKNLIKMKDIINSEFIIKNQDKILKLGDITPVCVFEHVSDEKIEEYYKYNTQNIEWFSEEFKTVTDWVESQYSLEYDYSFPEEVIDFLKEWVDCYPEFSDMLNEEYFEEYIENDGKLDHSEELNKIEKRFHELIMQRAGPMIEKYQIEMPHITIDLLEKSDIFSRINFPVPGMYGGFYYYLTIVNGEFLLDVDSWSRAVGGSGQNHEITADSCKLISEGFV